MPTAKPALEASRADKTGKRKESRGPINLLSLKEQVYFYLHEQIQKHKIRPGSAINMDTFSKKLGISKTPLRDALIELQMEGFVTILPRKGIYVNQLTLADIREFYEILGALESTALLIAYPRLLPDRILHMQQLNLEMKQALDRDDFDLFYAKNLEFHNTYLEKSGNATLVQISGKLKRRLYDFPRQEKWIKEWELSSLDEHRQIIEWLEKGDPENAARVIRNVHWSYNVQERFIRQYYSLKE